MDFKGFLHQNKSIFSFHFHETFEVSLYVNVGRGSWKFLRVGMEVTNGGGVLELAEGLWEPTAVCAWFGDESVFAW